MVQFARLACHEKFYGRGRGATISWTPRKNVFVPPIGLGGGRGAGGGCFAAHEILGGKAEPLYEKYLVYGGGVGWVPRYFIARLSDTERFFRGV